MLKEQAELRSNRDLGRPPHGSGPQFPPAPVKWVNTGAQHAATRKDSFLVSGNMSHSMIKIFLLIWEL